jgi:hypothetical protein
LAVRPLRVAVKGMPKPWIVMLIVLGNDVPRHASKDVLLGKEKVSV